MQHLKYIAMLLALSAPAQAEERSNPVEQIDDCCCHPDFDGFGVRKPPKLDDAITMGSRSITVREPCRGIPIIVIEPKDPEPKEPTPKKG